MSNRTTAARIVVGNVIKVEQGEGGLISTRRTRGAIDATVTGKEALSIPGQRTRRYVIETNHGKVVPVPGAQTFALVAEQSDTDGAAVGMVSPGHTSDAHTSHRTAPADIVDAARSLANGPAGYLMMHVCGNDVRDADCVPFIGATLGQAGSVNRNMLSPNRDRITCPLCRYFNGLEQIPAPVLDDDDSPVRDVTRCPEKDTHVAGVLGCEPFVIDCLGVPGHDIATRPVKQAAGATGAEMVAADIAAEFGRFGTVDDVRVGHTDIYGRGAKYVRPVSLVAFTYNGHAVRFVRYETRRVSGILDTLGALFVDDKPVPGSLDFPAACDTAALVARMRYRMREYLTAQTGQETPAVDVPAVSVGDGLGPRKGIVSADGFVYCGGRACGRKVRVIANGTRYGKHSNGINVCDRSNRLIDPNAPAPLVVMVKHPDPKVDMTKEAELWGDMDAPGDTVKVVFVKSRTSANILKCRIVMPSSDGDQGEGKEIDRVEEPDASSFLGLANLITIGAAASDQVTPDRDSNNECAACGAHTSEPHNPLPSGTPCPNDADALDNGDATVIDGELVPDDAVTGEVMDSVAVYDGEPAEVSGPVHLVDGVRHALPSVASLPADWSGPVEQIEGKAWRALLNRTLSAWFPGVVFSVRGDWGSVTVRWEGGPSARAVDLVADTFAGMDDSNHYRGAVLFCDGKGNATAYRIPGCFVSTSKTPDAHNRGAVLPVAEYVAGVGIGELLDADDAAGRFVPRSDRLPGMHEWLGGTTRELLNWLVSMGYDADTRIPGRDTREECGAPRCALAAGHTGHVHRTDTGRVFLADLTETRIRCTCGSLAPYTPAAGSEVIVLEHTNPAGNRCRRSLATHGGGGEIRTADVRYAPAPADGDDQGDGWNDGGDGPDDVPPALPTGPAGADLVDQVDAPATVPTSLSGLAALITGGRPAGLLPNVAQAAPSVPVGESIADVVARIRRDRAGELAGMMEEAERAGEAAHAAGGDPSGTWSPVVCRLQSQLDDTSDQGRADRGRILDAYRRGYLTAQDRADDAAERAARAAAPAVGTVATVQGWQETVFVTGVTGTHMIGICGGGDTARVPLHLVTGTQDLDPVDAAERAGVALTERVPADQVQSLERMAGHGDASAYISEGPDDAAYLVEHTRDGGTAVHGSSKGDGVWELLAAFGRVRTWGGHIYARGTRHKPASPARLRALAERIAAHTGATVRMVCDNRAADVAERIADTKGRAAARVERLQGRAVKAATDAHRLRQAADRATDGIPTGQPVLKGHHSQRKHENTLERSESLRRKGWTAGDRAEWLEARADGAYWTAKAKEDPRAMTRRRETLSAQARRMQRSGDVAGDGTTRGETLAEILEEIDLITASLEAAAAAGVYVAWTRDDFRPGDLVSVGGHWHRVIRANATSVTVPWWGSTTPDTDTRGDTVRYDKVYGRRRDGWQLDRPGDVEWSAADAHNVERWYALSNRAARPFSEPEAVESRRRVYAAERIRFGLPADAPLSVLEAHRANDTENQGTEGRRAVALALVAIYDRLRAGESFDQVAADVVAADVVPTWSMPEGKPVRIRIDQLKRGDIVAGEWCEGGTFGGGAEFLNTAFSGPVAYVSTVDRRNERGDFVTVRLESGDEKTGKTHRWFSAYPGGRDTVRVADVAKGDRVDVRGRDERGRPTRYAGYVLSAPSVWNERNASRHPMLSMVLAEYPDGANGWRGQVFTELDDWCAPMGDGAAAASALELAAESGRAAFHRGDMRAPAIDSVVLDLIADKRVGEGADQIMKAFTDAYDRESDAAARAALAD